MDFFSMIETENTDDCYNRWSEYREEVTDYIINTVEHYYIRKKLRKDKKIRLSEKYGIEEIHRELDKKPILAIWGAGGCNDIDIVRLSKYFKLILIDCNVEKLDKARERFMLDRENCACIDLKFWDVTCDDYLMYEAMLRDEVSVEEIEAFFMEICEKNEKSMDWDILPFDFSVVLGLASQLCSRFVAMAKLYNRRDVMQSQALADMNNKAVLNMVKAVNQMTGKVIVWGYEVYSLTDNHMQKAEYLVEKINRAVEYHIMEEGNSRICPEIAGNDYLFQELVNLKSNNICELFYGKGILWPFSEEKVYVNCLESYENQ